MSNEFLEMCYWIYKGYKQLGGRFLPFESILNQQQVKYNIEKATILAQIKERIMVRQEEVKI